MMNKGKLRINDNGDVSFWCPGCEEYHIINLSRPGCPTWTFNGNYDNPTFSPSVLVRSGHYIPGSSDKECWCNFKERFPNEGEPPFKCGICHSFIVNGKIQYLSDCTHKFAVQTIDMVVPN